MQLGPLGQPGRPARRRGRHNSPNGRFPFAGRTNEVLSGEEVDVVEREVALDTSIGKPNIQYWYYSAIVDLKSRDGPALERLRAYNYSETQRISPVKGIVIWQSPKDNVTLTNGSPVKSQGLGSVAPASQRVTLPLHLHERTEVLDCTCAAYERRAAPGGGDEESVNESSRHHIASNAKGKRKAHKSSCVWRLPMINPWMRRRIVGGYQIVEYTGVASGTWTHFIDDLIRRLDQNKSGAHTFAGYMAVESGGDGREVEEGKGIMRVKSGGGGIWGTVRAWSEGREANLDYGAVRVRIEAAWGGFED
ncbi:hypothetical protein FB451DRAFT_1171977 [Mycena latifolia]|nr:hypothetical protein FB451DRAFT_1171977 [Mycena latifolia]